MEPIDVECDQTWMERIHPNSGHPDSGKKDVEGRLNKGKYKVGDVLRFHTPDNKLWVICKISRLHEEADFGKLYEKLGEKLLPGIKTVEEAVSVYDQWFKKKVKTFGAVGIEFVILDKS